MDYVGFYWNCFEEGRNDVRKCMENCKVSIGLKWLYYLDSVVLGHFGGSKFVVPVRTRKNNTNVMPTFDQFFSKKHKPVSARG